MTMSPGFRRMLAWTLVSGVTTIAANIAGQHGGTLACRPNAGGGSVFRLELPARYLHLRTHCQGGSAMSRKHIFVVDDDSSLRRVMKMQLEEAGYEVSLASDGDQAWKMLKEVEPQLIITDLQMPTTGLELLSRMQKKECRRRSSSSLHLGPSRPRWKR